MGFWGCTFGGRRADRRLGEIAADSRTRRYSDDRRLSASCRASGRRWLCAASHKLSLRCLSRRIVPPTDRRLHQTHLRQRERLGRVVRMYPPHCAQQHLALPAQIEEHPHPVTLARRTRQEIMGLPLDRLAEVERGEGCRRPAATARGTCTTNVTAHRVLLFASDLHFPGRGPDAGDGLPVRAGGLFVLGLSLSSPADLVT